MATIGQKLRQERERLGIPFSDIARETRISARYLEAIEAEDTQTLPHDFFYRSFVRQYAEYLGMSADEVTTTLKRETAVQEAMEEAARPAPKQSVLPLIAIQPEIPSGARSTAAIFEEARTSKAWLAVAALLLVGSVSYLATRQGSSESPALSASNDAPAVESSAASGATSVSTAPKQGEVSAEIGPNAVVQATDLGSGRLQIVISAREQTWIKLVADGKNVFMGLIEPGQSQAIQNASNAELVTGNAGGIEVKQNGRALPGLGSSGEVRTVVFDTENYQVKQPAPKPKSAEPAGDSQTTSSSD